MFVLRARNLINRILNISEQGRTQDFRRGGGVKSPKFFDFFQS